MARIRTVKPEFWKDEDLSELPAETHMLAAALLNYADDEGYFNANARLIKAECMPLREDSAGIDESLAKLAKTGYITLGTSPEGKQYGHVVHFTEHQRINRPTESKIKNKTITWHRSRAPHGGCGETARPEGKGQDGKGAGTKSNAPSRRARPEDGLNDPVVETIPLAGGDAHPVHASEIAEYERLYPAVDVRQEVRSMRGWSADNPKKRKTPGGVKRFITNWLIDKQNRGGSGRKGANHGPSNPGSDGACGGSATARYWQRKAERDAANACY
jgi:hypothetical protein